jgi:predicted deacylase
MIWYTLYQDQNSLNPSPCSNKNKNLHSMSSYTKYDQNTRANLSLYHFFKQNQNGPIPFSIEFISPNPGKHVVFIVGSHGNEPAGLIALEKIHGELTSSPELLISGKATFILANPEAVRRNQKFIYSDLNQTFNGKIKNGLESQRAEEIDDYFKNNQEIDLVLDLYSTLKNKPRIVFYNLNDVENLKLMSKVTRFSLFVNINNEMFPGALILSSCKYGILSYGVSFGNEVQERSISIAYDIFVAALERNNIIERNKLIREKSLRKPKEIDIYYPRESIKPVEGFAFENPALKTSDQLKKGEIYATYQGGFYMAKEDSFVLLLTKKVKRDNLGFLCKKYTLVVKDPEIEESSQ